MSDRKALIRLASTLPKGSDERKAILAGLVKTATSKTADSFSKVMRDATRIFGSRVELDEESDGNIIVLVDEDEMEDKYSKWIRVWPDGEMVEDGIATGVFS